MIGHRYLISVHTGSGAIIIDDGCDRTPKCIDVLTLDSDDLETMSLKGLLQVVSLEVVGGMTRNSDVIIINQELDVQALSNSETSSLRVVTLLLRTIRTKTEDDFVSVGEGDTVDMWPHVTETTRRELDTGCQAKFRVTWEF